MLKLHTACAFIFSLAAVIALAFSLIFAGFDMPRDAAFSLVVGLLFGLAAFAYREMAKPRNWSR